MTNLEVSYVPTVVHGGRQGDFITLTIEPLPDPQPPGEILVVYQAHDGPPRSLPRPFHFPLGRGEGALGNTYLSSGCPCPILTEVENNDNMI